MPWPYVHTTSSGSLTYEQTIHIPGKAKSTLAVYNKSRLSDQKVSTAFLKKRYKPAESSPFALGEASAYKRQCLRLSALTFADSKPEQELHGSLLDFESSPEPQGEGESSLISEEGFCVVNFYHLTDLAQPHAVLARHRRWLHDRDIQGRIYISFQGINAQLSGPERDAHAYASWVSEQEGFQVCTCISASVS